MKILGDTIDNTLALAAMTLQIRPFGGVSEPRSTGWQIAGTRPWIGGHNFVGLCLRHRVGLSPAQFRNARENTFGSE